MEKRRCQTEISFACKTCKYKELEHYQEPCCYCLLHGNECPLIDYSYGKVYDDVLCEQCKWTPKESE